MTNARFSADSLASICRIATMLVAMAPALLTSRATADPPGGSTTTTPAIPPFISPPVFCFRITDIRDVVGDPEGNAFDFEIEVLNWTNMPAFGFELSLATSPRLPTAGATPMFLAGGSSIDSNGRPGTPADDDANYSPADGTVMPPKVGAPNAWGVGGSTPSRVEFLTPGPGLPSRDLLGVLPLGTGPMRTAAALALVPSESGAGATPNSVDSFGRPVIPIPETIDNGGFAGDALPDNALDGFIMRLDDFDPGEALSVNWFLKDSLGTLLGTSGGGNAYGFGNFNISRAEGLEAVWRRRLNDPFGPGQNRGALILPGSTIDMFTSISDGGSVFATEFGAALTAPFLNPGDACPDCGVSAEPIPPPMFVQQGFDIFQTVSGQTFMRFPTTTNQGQMMGVPIPDMQFQSITGFPGNPGGVDTIVRRRGVLDPLGPPQQQIQVEIVALSLQSVAPIDLGMGNGPEILHVSLAPGSHPLGILAVNFERMTFSSLLPLQFQVQGSNGTMFTDQISLQVANAQFSSLDLSKLTIPGLNAAFIPLMFGGQGVSQIGGVQMLHTLMVPPAPSFTADFDGDNDVDKEDLAQWFGDFGENGNSDADGDGDSDGADFLAWQQQLGSGLSLTGANTIPEPATLYLLIVAAIALKLRRR